jgi:hypothetical protein
VGSLLELRQKLLNCHRAIGNVQPMGGGILFYEVVNFVLQIREPCSSYSDFVTIRDCNIGEDSLDSLNAPREAYDEGLAR